MKRIFIFEFLSIILLLVSFDYAGAAWIDFPTVYSNCPYYADVCTGAMTCMTGDWSADECIQRSKSVPKSIVENDITCTWTRPVGASATTCCCKGRIWVPDKPVVKTSVKSNTINISWNADPRNGVSEYTLYWDTKKEINYNNNSNRVTIAGTRTSFSHTNLLFNKTYYYELRAKGYVRFVNSTTFNTKTGQIVKTGSPRRFEAESDVRLGHQQGYKDADGWACNTTANSYNAMVFGPYITDVSAGKKIVTFRMMVDNNSADNLKVVTIDVNDYNSDKVLAYKDITRRQFTKAHAYQNFDLLFDAKQGQKLEFRVWWFQTSYVRVDRIDLFSTKIQ